MNVSIQFCGRGRCLLWTKVQRTWRHANFFKLKSYVFTKLKCLQTYHRSSAQEGLSERTDLFGSPYILFHFHVMIFQNTYSKVTYGVCAWSHFWHLNPLSSVAASLPALQAIPSSRLKTGGRLLYSGAIRRSPRFQRMFGPNVAHTGSFPWPTLGLSWQH